MWCVSVCFVFQISIKAASKHHPQNLKEKEKELVNPASLHTKATTVHGNSCWGFASHHDRLWFRFLCHSMVHRVLPGGMQSQSPLHRGYTADSGWTPLISWCSLPESTRKEENLKDGYDPDVIHSQVHGHTYLHLVDIRGMVPKATVVRRSFAAAVRNQPFIPRRLDPHTTCPVCGAVTSTTLKLRHSMEQRENSKNIRQIVVMTELDMNSALVMFTCHLVGLI